MSVAAARQEPRELGLSQAEQWLHCLGWDAETVRDPGIFASVVEPESLGVRNGEPVYRLIAIHGPNHKRS